MKFLLRLLFLSIFSVSIQAESEFEVNTGLLLGYDSNVAVDEIDLFTTKGDSFLTGRFKLGYEYAVNEKQSLKASYSLSDKHYADNDQFNLQNHLVSIGYDIKYQKVTFGLTYRYVNSLLDSNQFLILSQVTPSVSWFISKQHYIRFAYTFYDKSLENNPDRDANSHELSTDYYYFMNGLNSYFILAIKAREEDAKDDLFNYSSQQLRIAFLQRFDLAGSPLKATLDFRARKRDYNDKILPVIDDFRSDKNYSSSFSLEWEVGQHWLWEWQIEYSDRQSNLASVDFSQWLSTAGLEYKF